MEDKIGRGGEESRRTKKCENMYGKQGCVLGAPPAFIYIQIFFATRRPTAHTTLSAIACLKKPPTNPDRPKMR